MTRDALDKDETSQRTSKITDLEGRIAKLRESLPSDRAKLGL